MITHHGISPFFIMDNYLLLSIGYTNTQSFEIKEIIFYHSKIYSYEIQDKELPITYTAGSTLIILIRFTFNMNKFDTVLLRPILRFVAEGQNEDSFFVPLIPAIREIPMNYYEIRDYIANL